MAELLTIGKFYCPFFSEGGNIPQKGVDETAPNTRKTYNTRQHTQLKYIPSFQHECSSKCKVQRGLNSNSNFLLYLGNPGFHQKWILTIQCVRVPNYPYCISMPNFSAIGQRTAGILRTTQLLRPIFQEGRFPRSTPQRRGTKLNSISGAPKACTLVSIRCSI